MSVDFQSLEQELCRVPEINAARIVTDDEGRPVEVHILSLPTKHAKQVVRDVQSVAMAQFDLDIDRRMISVVQLDGVATSSLTGDDETAGSDGPLGRIYVDGVTALRNGLQCTAQVVLTRAGEKATGVAEGLGATNTVLRLVAQATVSALRHLEPAAARADVENAVVIQLGNRAVAVANVVVMVPPYEEIVSGSAMVRAAGELDAVARAVLDATNRRLPQLR
ncbi:MAG: hypothetical protein ACR2H3_05855 [Acidimicrobiales bacterium]